MRSNTDNKNPWLGWSSYDEYSISQGYRFVGRSTEISQLFYLVDNNLLVTLYGKSGIGKTSLLQAGISPLLRAADYVPVICRCSPDEDYASTIIKQIKCKCVVRSKEESENYSIVEFFKQCSFSLDGNEKEVFPVLIFDQFEDWFRMNPDGVGGLLSDISFLVSDSYEGKTNYRFVFSIREDYLYLLEDAIDGKQFADLKQNRYRLTHFGKDAVDEILALGAMPGEVKDRVLQLTKDGYNDRFHPGLVSFFCHELWEKFPQGITEKAMLSLADGNELIADYYNRCFKESGISKSAQEYIEKTMQDGGVRRPQNLKRVSAYLKEKELETLLTGRYKLLQKFPVGDDEHVELIHDKIAEIIHQNRETELGKQRNYLVAFTLLLYFIPVTYFIWNILIEMLRLSYIFNVIGSPKIILGTQLGAGLYLLFCVAYLLPAIICDWFMNKKLAYRAVPAMVSIAISFNVLYQKLWCSSLLEILSQFILLFLLLFISVIDYGKKRK